MVHLAGLKNLDLIFVVDTAVTSVGVEFLQKQLPNATINDYSLLSLTHL